MRPILLKGHDGPLTCVKYNRDGDLLFTTCRRGRICMWYSDDGERIGTYNGGSGAAMYVDVSFGSDKLATASMDQCARLWEVETGQELRKWEMGTGVRCVSIATGDKRVAVLADPWGDEPSTIKIFDTSSNEKPVQVLKMDHGARVNRALWGPLNRQIITCTENGGVLSWDPDQGECTHERDDHEQNVSDITFGLDQMTFISASTDQSAILYDTVTVEPIKTYKADRPINSAAISPLMDHVIVGGGQSADKVTTTAGRSGKFQSVFFHKIFENEIGSIKGHFGPINSIMCNPDGRSFTTGGEDGYVRIHHFDPEYFSLE
eukprot:CAMPEP_0174928798 /NCGR_PEP_ID=MMETSP1355-20121228/26074_1 /TAXON_ID=464990 /ORGANISM="Hemiselmis tepida, Strain CCMP443" /LENGTH=318 /DNA_ID=CAMNT_0016174975 /DNA_START=98 /DNA_END=1054 /DNA_ORIENTATION=-